MTVAELIAYLQMQPQHLQVAYQMHSEQSVLEVEEIEIKELFNLARTAGCTITAQTSPLSSICSCRGTDMNDPRTCAFAENREFGKMGATGVCHRLPGPCLCGLQTLNVKPGPQKDLFDSPIEVKLPPGGTRPFVKTWRR